MLYPVYLILKKSRDGRTAFMSHSLVQRVVYQSRGLSERGGPGQTESGLAQAHNRENTWDDTRGASCITSHVTVEL